MPYLICAKVSDLPDFLQGRCTTREKYNDVAWVHSYLRKQKLLLIDCQGEMMGHAGEIYFAVIRPMSLNMELRSQHVTELESDHMVDSAASTLDTVASAEGDHADVELRSFDHPQPPPATKCSGFILDMKSQALGSGASPFSVLQFHRGLLRAFEGTYFFQTQVDCCDYSIGTVYVLFSTQDDPQMSSRNRPTLSSSKTCWKVRPRAR